MATNCSISSVYQCYENHEMETPSSEENIHIDSAWNDSDLARLAQYGRVCNAKTSSTTFS